MTAVVHGETPIRALLFDPHPERGRNTTHLLDEAGGGRVVVGFQQDLLAAERALRHGDVDALIIHADGGDGQLVRPLLYLGSELPTAIVVVLPGDHTGALKEVVDRRADDWLVEGQLRGDELYRAVKLAAERTRRRRIERKLANSEFGLRLAREIQFRMFPLEAPATGDLLIGGATYPAEAVDGDYFDYMTLCDGSLGIVVGDACGHGIGAALLIAETRACLRTLALSHADPARILRHANYILCEGMPENRFVTLTLVRLDCASRLFTYASAGHATGYLLDADGKVRSALTSTGFPLGVEKDGDFGLSDPMRLRPGDLLLLITDGVLEAPSPDGESFGIRRALDLVQARRDRPPRQIVDDVYQAVCDHCRQPLAVDDITLLVVKCPG